MKMFILVRADLDPSYRMVQGMHAVYELSAILGSHPIEVRRRINWGGTMVCLIVKDQKELLKWNSKISAGILRCLWREPDLNDENTAFACLPDDDNVFKNLQLA